MQGIEVGYTHLKLKVDRQAQNSWFLGTFILLKTMILTEGNRRVLERSRLSQHAIWLNVYS